MEEGFSESEVKNIKHELHEDAQDVPFRLKRCPSGCIIL